MELLDITLTRLQRRNRAAFVHRSEIAGRRDLVPGEKVVLRDEEGEYYAGTVIDRMDESDDPRFLVNVGVRLPEEYAVRRLSAAANAETRAQLAEAVTADTEIQELLDLLGEARALMAGASIPAQRLAR